MPNTREPSLFPPGSKPGRFPTPGVWRLDQFLVDPACEPVEFLLAVMRDETQPFSRRLDAARAVAPYCHIKIDDPFFRTLTKGQLDQIRNIRVIDYRRS